jgi:hypothetical protein
LIEEVRGLFLGGGLGRDAGCCWAAPWAARPGEVGKVFLSFSFLFLFSGFYLIV